MTTRLTRRKLLKLIAASTAAAALSPAFHARARYPLQARAGVHQDLDIWTLMGRAIHSLAFYEEPVTSSTRLATRARDESFVITREVHAPFSAHNTRWYETPLGYVHSAWVLPVRVYPPQLFVSDAGEWGFWGEVCQPWTEAYDEPSVHARKAYRFYGGTVFHVVDALQDVQGTGWYKVYDEFPPTDPTHQWVLARDMRRIPRSEMAPIRPFVGQKRIEVDLDKQRLNCLEGDRIAYTTLVASGLGSTTMEIEDEEGEKKTIVIDLGTPKGETNVLLKQPSRHMSNHPYPGGPPAVADLFDLPGIPWNVFFDLSGTAIHGAYWHNDFGVKRSHGCLNVSMAAARWIYRWVYPIGGYEDDYIQSDRRVGTAISIF